jgi:ABC-type glycerol-3-phosphate transport system permease component
MITFREKLTSYLILGPFAVVLAFPFYWMLWTSFKTEQDLYDVNNVPFFFGHGSPTTKNYSCSPCPPHTRSRGCRDAGARAWASASS